MPRTALTPQPDGSIYIGEHALRSRINRALNRLIPYQELIYDRASGAFFVRTVSVGAPDHMRMRGPYLFKHFSGLARMLGCFDKQLGYDHLPTVNLLSDRGKLYPEQELPPELRFDVVTPALRNALNLLAEHGYTVSPPVTETVTLDPEFTEED